MGLSSIWHWLIVLLVVLIIFGTGKLKNIGKDLGSAVKGFKEGLKEAGDDVAEVKDLLSKPAEPSNETKATTTKQNNIIDAENKDS